MHTRLHYSVWFCPRPHPEPLLEYIRIKAKGNLWLDALNEDYSPILRPDARAKSMAANLGVDARPYKKPCSPLRLFNAESLPGSFYDRWAYYSDKANFLASYHRSCALAVGSE